jgi:ATP-dependent RNA helicase DDX46/PRP5
VLYDGAGKLPSRSQQDNDISMEHSEPKLELSEEIMEEEDPLDQFMVGVTTQVEKIKAQDELRLSDLTGSTTIESIKNAENSSDDEEMEDILAYAAKKLAKKKDIAVVDHSSMSYEPFRKDFFIEPPELAELSSNETKELRLELDGIKVAGKDCPKPAKKWTHCGLPTTCLDIVKKQAFHAPTPIQAQAIPAIMSGRDVIGVAKTGSGKTLAFLLPLFRHINDQRPIEIGEGPIALIMTPTRELAMQIHKEAKLFGKPLGVRSACCYGGSPISDQIADLKRGAEIIVCTPGRMIDLLCANSGRVTNLYRVTYLVLDEADRMFDMGFEPQVMKIVNNIRPDRQTVLFSATFPRPMEALARKILKRPLEITVGGKSVVATDVAQIVEVREESTKFLRLLEILGKWFDGQESRVLIFVDRQEAADHLMNTLMKRGYVCNSLHGGKDQMDRDSTISDFKTGMFPILIATSVAARGLDVKGLNLVVNYDCPNHKEDYVHRVGRTGRAGNKGTAFTFITSEQERYSSDIVDALRASGADIPADLMAMASLFREKVKAGHAQRASSGFGGKGLEVSRFLFLVKLRLLFLFHA